LLDEFDAGLAFFRPDGSLESNTGDQQFWEFRAEQVRPVIRDLIEQDNPATLISSAHTNPQYDEKMVQCWLALTRAGLGCRRSVSAADLVNHTLTSASPVDLKRLLWSWTQKGCALSGWLILL
jgi:hypothetical protein